MIAVMQATESYEKMCYKSQANIFSDAETFQNFTRELETAFQ